MSTLPNSGATELVDAQDDAEAAVNEMGRLLDAFVSRSIIQDRDLTAPPGSCADGARYLIAASPTGAWSGQAGKLAVAVGTNAANGWLFVTVAVEGVELYVRDENLKILHDGSGWVSASAAIAELDDIPDVNAPSPSNNDVLTWDSTPGEWVAAPLPTASNPTESIIVACGDESSAITTGTAKVTFRMPYAFTLTAVRASVTTAPTGSTIIIDINEAGSTILSTKLSIDASEKTSTTAASAAVISDSALADDAEITIDFDQVGSTIAGAGVKVTLIGHRP